MAGIRVGVDNVVRAETDRMFATVDEFDTPWSRSGRGFWSIQAIPVSSPSGTFPAIEGV
jgi:hypothetical protein